MLCQIPYKNRHRFDDKEEQNIRIFTTYHGHILRSNYVVLNCSNLILGPDTSLNLVKFDRNSVDSVLIPNKCVVTLPEMYNITCGCKKNALEDVSAASLALHTQNFASATEKYDASKFTN